MHSVSRRLKNTLYRIEPLAFFIHNAKMLVHKKHWRTFRHTIRYVAHLQNRSAIVVFGDLFVKCLVSCGLYSDYVTLHLYEKTIREAARCCAYGRQVRFLSQLKTREAAAVFYEKPRFNDIFAKFLKRDILAVTEDTPREAFEAFIGRHAVFVAKPPKSNAGRDVWLVDRAAYPNAGDLLGLLKEKGTTLLEERVHNHKELDAFSKTSLNTLRIIAVRLPEGVNIIAAFLKFNLMGGIADNLARGGYACPIDMETGVIIKGMTKMGVDARFIELHPDGFPIPGIKIPFWEQVVALAKEATLFMDDVYFVPWDIAVTEEGPLIIEGNNVPSFDFQVMMDRPANSDLKRAYRFARKNKRLKRKTLPKR